MEGKKRAKKKTFKPKDETEDTKVDSSCPDTSEVPLKYVNEAEQFQSLCCFLGTVKEKSSILPILLQMKQFLYDSKLKIPTACSSSLLKLVELLEDSEMVDHKEEVLDLLKIIITSPVNGQFVSEAIKQQGLIPKLVKIALAEKSRALVKKEFKLISLTLAHKPLRDIIITKHLSEITGHVKASCKKGICEIQWEGLYVFLRALAKAWPPIPFEKVRDLWGIILDRLCEKAKSNTFHGTLAGLLAKLEPTELYILVKSKYKEVISRVFALVQGAKEPSIGYAKLLKKVVALNDIAAETFIQLEGIDFLQNILLPQWDPYTYKILAELCAKPRFVDEVLKTTLIKDLIVRISRGRIEEAKAANPPEEDKKELKKAAKSKKGKAAEEEKTKPEKSKITAYLKAFDKIIKKSKSLQIEKFVEFGALEALAKYLQPTDPALDTVYEAISDILKEGRHWYTDRQNPISAKAEAIGLRRKIMQCTGQQNPAGALPAHRNPFHP